MCSGLIDAARIRSGLTSLGRDWVLFGSGLVFFWSSQLGLNKGWSGLIGIRQGIWQGAD